MPRKRHCLALAPTIGLALAGCVALAGCANSTPQAGPARSSAPAASAAPSTAPPLRGAAARAQFTTFAAAVNLRPADLPGWAAKPKHRAHRSSTPADEALYRRCLGANKEATPIFKADSPKFESGRGLQQESASSEVQLLRTPAVAEQELALTSKLLQRPGSRACLARAFDAILAHGHSTTSRGHKVRFTIGHVQIAPLPLGSAVAGTGGGLGISISMHVTYFLTLRARTVTIPTSLYIDTLGFILGRASVGLTTMALGEPFPAELEASLFSRLVSRALQARSHTQSVVQ